MSISYYAQEEQNEPLLVCPDCGQVVLVSEYGELGFCENCLEEYPLSTLPASVIKKEAES